MTLDKLKEKKAFYTQKAKKIAKEINQKNSLIEELGIGIIQKNKLKDDFSGWIDSLEQAYFDKTLLTLRMNETQTKIANIERIIQKKTS